MRHRFDESPTHAMVRRMCGRYTVKDPAGAASQIHAITGESVEVLAARYNVSPSQVMRIVAGGDRPRSQDMRWGFIPFWEKSDKPKLAPINARSEEAFAKPMFRQAIQRRRCAIPADGFFEWQKLDEKTKLPYHFRRKDSAPFFFAGIYEEATEVRPFTYLLFTCQPNAVVAPVHDRMPAILREDTIRSWLAAGEITADAFGATCQPYPAELFESYPVSPLVNKPANDVPECVAPAGAITIEKKLTPTPSIGTQPDLFA